MSNEIIGKQRRKITGHIIEAECIMNRMCSQKPACIFTLVLFLLLMNVYLRDKCVIKGDILYHRV